MGRAKAILQSEFPYNISARCINREWFELPMDQVWSIFSDELARAVAKHGLLIHAFVLMSNHFHLIASTPDANISQCMQQFMHRSSRRLTKQGNRINQTFAGRHYKCIMQHPNYFLNAYKYVYRNPVRAGICDRVEDYPFSTLQTIMGKTSRPFPMAEDTTYEENPEQTLKWLNTKPTEAQLGAFRCGTHRPYFRSKKCKITKKPILDVTDLL